MGWGSGFDLSYGVGRRHGSDPTWLWLWYRLAAAALICPLAWELPYAAGVALESKKKPKTKTNNTGSPNLSLFSDSFWQGLGGRGW